MALLEYSNTSSHRSGRRTTARMRWSLLAAVALLGVLVACKPPPTNPTPLPDMPNMGSDKCMFTTFCDAFETRQPGGRAGDLDETRWSFSRLSQENNPSQGTVNKFVPVNAEFCMTKQVRLASNDSFICGTQFGEANHWMEAIYDNGSYVMDSNRILQPFDFANRTARWTSRWTPSPPAGTARGSKCGSPPTRCSHRTPTSPARTCTRRTRSGSPSTGPNRCRAGSGRAANSLRVSTSSTTTSCSARRELAMLHDEGRHAQPLPDQGGAESRRGVGVRRRRQQLPPDRQRPRAR